MSNKKITLSDKHFASLINSLFNQLNINFFAIDKDGYYIARNHSLTKIVGETERADKVEEKAWQSCLRVMETGQVEIVEEAYKNCWYLSFKSPLIEDNQTIGVIGISLDITDRKQAEMAKNEFLLNMQHDLRTPFSGILAMTSFVHEKETDPIKKEFLGQSLEASESLLKLLDQILELSRLGSYGLASSEFNIFEEVSSIIAMMAAEAKSKGIALTVECPSTYVFIDKLRISRILLNLVGNAVKFTNKGGVHLKIKVDSYLRISVKDTGVGIAKSQVKHIFDKFYKVNSSYRTGQFKGAGLGLYITKQFVDELSGTLSVKSIEQKGSTFTCIIPLLTKEAVA